MATRRKRTQGSKPTVLATAGPELVVVMRTQTAFRASAGRFMSAAGANVSDVGKLLGKYGATMQPIFGPTEERVIASAARHSLRAQAPMADLSVFYRVDVPAAQMEELRDKLASNEVVEAAYVKPPVGLPVINDMLSAPEEPPPASPDFAARQLYLDAPPGGVNARWAWTQAGGRGRDVRIIDIEGDWRFSHEDLMQNQGGIVGGNASLFAGDVNWRNHGTAVLGEFSGDVNTIGVVGIASDAMASAVSHGGIGSSAAINLAAARLRPGDVLLLEMHRPGPRFAFANRPDQRGFIAVEWWPDDFAAILNATSRGIIVVEAAGNGAENLDDNLYQTPAAGFPPGWTNPFRRSNRDSGAIVVGAGAPPPGTHGSNHGPDRSRLDFSNWGALVDAQGWGREVTTSGYGDLQGGVNEDLWYTDRFSGTSSASPIVTGVIACIQGMARARGVAVLTPAQVRNCLRTTGSPQADGPGAPATQRIGNRPDIRAFATCAFGKGKETKEFTKEKEIKEKDKERKEFVKEKEKEKERVKDLKDLKEGKEKEKELKEFKEQKEFKEKDKDIFENKRFEAMDIRPQAGAGEERLAALEQTVQQLVHFISTEFRPDLSQSALQDGSEAAKQEKDLKDAEKQSES